MRTENAHLVVSVKGEDQGRVPWEDLGLLILDQTQCTITQAALAAASQNGAVVAVCGRDHHPCGFLLPLAGNQLHPARLRLQIEMNKPLGKRLWRQLVRAKLAGQAAMLPEKNVARVRISQLAKNVRLGDPDNKEAQGARFYWPALFGKAFRRSREGPPPNNLLNFGYMVLRAATARAIVSAGLHPALGIEHSHRNNAFALADDLLEPYRPFVDERVLFMWRQGHALVKKETKRQLYSLLATPIATARGQSPLTVALDRTATSFVDCLRGENNALELPVR